MDKSIVVYYSKTGSNKYLANRISDNLNCEIEEIKPKVKSFFLLMIFSLLKISPGIHDLKRDLNDYNRVILCGPIWMGNFISPLNGFIKKYLDKISNIYFVTCCGSSYLEKDSKFGHNKVFDKLKEVLVDKNLHCEAFPITLVVPKEKAEDSNEVMNTRLSDENFKGEILVRFNDFIDKLK